MNLTRNFVDEILQLQLSLVFFLLLFVFCNIYIFQSRSSIFNILRIKLSPFVLLIICFTLAVRTELMQFTNHMPPPPHQRWHINLLIYYDVYSTYVHEFCLLLAALYAQIFHPKFNWNNLLKTIKFKSSSPRKTVFK